MLQGQVFGRSEATFIGTSVEMTWSGVHVDGTRVLSNLDILDILVPKVGYFSTRMHVHVGVQLGIRRKAVVVYPVCDARFSVRLDTVLSHVRMHDRVRGRHLLRPHALVA
jgi:hypothetical protein